MKNIEITKTPTSYTLTCSRASKTTAITLTVVLALGGLAVTALILFASAFTPLIKWILAIAAFLLYELVMPALLLTLSYGLRWVADEEGFHRYIWNRKNKSIPWRYARSCGIAPYVAESASLFFYVSTEPESHKDKEPKNAVQVGLTDDNVQTVRDSGLIPFCRAHIMAAQPTEKEFRHEKH